MNPRFLVEIGLAEYVLIAAAQRMPSEAYHPYRSQGGYPEISASLWLA